MKLIKILPFFDTSTERWSAEARLLRWMLFLWLFAGLAVLFSASYTVAEAGFNDGLYYFKQQLIWAVLGLILFNAVVHFPLRSMVKIGTIGFFIVLALLFATHIPGIGATINGSTRWLAVTGSYVIQPSELIKPFFVLQAAQLFGHWSRTKWSYRVIWLGLFVISLAGILLQPSLSMTALCGITLWLTALAAGLPMVQLLPTAMLGIITAVVSVSVKEYQQRRLMSFLNPWVDQAGDGYQLVQSLMAIGSGNNWGVGFGLSSQKSFLPFQYTDFIFAVFAEEFGLVGGISLVVMLMLFAAIGLRVAIKCKDPVVRLVAIGSTVLLVGQSFLNMGVATGVLPTTGLPFPLFSYGGSSMLSSLVVLGLLIRSAREMATAEVIPFERTPVKPGDSRAKRQERLSSKRRRSYSTK